MADMHGPNGTPAEPAKEKMTGSEQRRGRRRRPSFFWPLVLVSAGVLLLLSNLGYLPGDSWNLLWRLWPLLLIALGIDVLIGRRSLVGAIISGILILMLLGGAILIVLFAQNIPAMSQSLQDSEWQMEHVEYPIDGAESASITIDWTSLPGQLAAVTDSPNLIEADVSYRGELIFDADRRGSRVAVELDTALYGPVLWPSLPGGFGERAERRWDVGLSPDLPLELWLDVGSGSCTFDLSALQISGLFIDGGSGSMDLSLPPTGSYEIEIDGGSGSMDIVLPQSVGAQVDLDAGSGSFSPDGRFRLVAGERGGDGVWETESFDTAEHRVRFAIDQGSGSLSID
jgi:hypothetical protein